MKVTIKQIMKPGAVLEVKKIDFASKEVQSIVEDLKWHQRQMLKHRVPSRKTLECTITDMSKLR